MELWIGIAIAGIVGFALGALVMWWMDRKQGGGSSVATLKKEHEQFREQVTEHFVETAQRINRLTDSYKDLFDHLSQGAETLVDDASLRERMPQVSDQEVRLKRLGTRTGSDRQAGSGTRSDVEDKPPQPGASKPASSPAPDASKPSAAERDETASDDTPKARPAGASAAKAGTPAPRAGSAEKATPTDESSSKAGKPAD